MSGHLTNDSLIDFIHGELAPEDDAYVHGHLVACDACRQNYDAEVWLSDALRTAASAEEREFPSLVAAHVWEKVRTLQAGPLERIAAFLSPIARPALAVPLGLALLVGAYFASPLGHTGGAGPTIEASYYLEQHAAQEASNALSEHSTLQPIESSMNVGTGATANLAETDVTGMAVSSAIDVVR